VYTGFCCYGRFFPTKTALVDFKLSVMALILLYPNLYLDLGVQFELFSAPPSGPALHLKNGTLNLQPVPRSGLLYTGRERGYAVTLGQSKMASCLKPLAAKPKIYRRIERWQLLMRR
jgi:hypothetical protein